MDIQKINVYDINTLIKEQTENKYRSHIEIELAFIELPLGIIVTGIEGVHYIENIVTDSVRIDISKYTDSTISIIPINFLDFTIKYIKDYSPKRETTLGEFIRRFGGRLEENYKLLLKSIKELGGDPKMFPRNPPKIGYKNEK